jgi:hypothetical protein
MTQPRNQDAGKPTRKLPLARAVLNGVVGGAAIMLMQKGKWQERLGIQDNSWQQWLFGFVVIFVAIGVFNVVWVLGEKLLGKGKG